MYPRPPLVMVTAVTPPEIVATPAAPLPLPLKVTAGGEV
jgi:hypothetical protein